MTATFSDETTILQTVLQQLFGDLVIIDAAGAIIYALPGSEQRYGERFKGLKNVTLDDLFTSESARELEGVIQTVLNQRSWVNLQVVLNPRLERGGIVQVAVVPFNGEGGKVILMGQSQLVSLLEADEERREREKELACLYRVGQAIEDAATVDDYFTVLPAIVAQGFRFPMATYVHVRHKSLHYGHPNTDGHVALSYPLIIGGEEAGAITVWTTEELNFLREEHQMLQEVCRVSCKAIEKYEQEMALEQTFRRLQTLVQAIPDRIALLDRDFNVLISNDQEGDAKGHRCYRHYYDKVRPCKDCPVAEVLKTGKPAMRKWEHPNQVLLFQAYPVVRQDGQVDGVVEYVKDVTQEERVQEQLMHADKMASLGQLTAGVAHEINNPVQFISENIRIMREALADIMPHLDVLYQQEPHLRIARLPFLFFKKQAPILAEDVENGAIRIRDIVASLKQFARNNEGLLNEWVSMGEAIETSLRLTHNQVKNTATVLREIEPDLPRVRGNAQKIEQVLVNIIINAVQAIHDQRAKLEGRERLGEIRIKAIYLAEQELLRLTLADNGPGIPPDNLKRVFDPFFTTKQHSGGTGLGLSIAYGIIQEHKGSIKVSSQPGVGTTFSITLPASKKECP